MTAFPEWPAPFNLCVVCLGSVSVQELTTGVGDPTRWPKWSVHAGVCNKTWSNLVAPEREEYLNRLEEHRASQHRARYDTSAANGDNEYWHNQVKGLPSFYQGHFR